MKDYRILLTKNSEELTCEVLKLRKDVASLDLTLFQKWKEVDLYMECSRKLSKVISDLVTETITLEEFKEVCKKISEEYKEVPLYPEEPFITHLLEVEEMEKEI